MIDVYFTSVSKRKNSTLQPDFTGITAVSCALKAPTSEEAPAFLLHWTGGSFPYNYCRWGDHYYWIDGVTFERNDLLTVSCSLDVLATYKASILASTQFVAYSSVSGGAWLPDRRIAVMADSIVTVQPATLNQMNASGNYILTVLGKTGCTSYILIKYRIGQLLAAVQTNNDNIIQDAMDAFDTSWSGTIDYVPDALGALAQTMMQTDLLGNAYENAVSCLRSCIWVPFSAFGMSGDPETIYLGNYNTGQVGNVLASPTKSETVTVNIPWHYSDWRRAYSEDIALYLPLVGIVNLSSDQISQATSLTITAAYCYMDGCVAYEVKAGDQVIGTYGGNCAAQYPLGINQTASAGQIANTLASGISKTVGSLTAKNIPSIAAAGNALVTAYETADTAYSTNPSVIGGIGGGAGSLLDLDIKCISVAHQTVISPADMAATMGLPTQKPLTLSACSGYCQCINAHVSAPAHGDVINAIDEFINTGFYIE